MRCVSGWGCSMRCDCVGGGVVHRVIILVLHLLFCECLVGQVLYVRSFGSMLLRGW